MKTVLRASDKDTCVYTKLDAEEETSPMTYKAKISLILAIDFDGTIVEHKFPYIGKLLPGAKETINKWKDEGHRIIIWTCRNMVEPAYPEIEDATIFGAKRFLDENGIKYDAINSDVESVPFYIQARKVFADIYIDDRNLGGFPGWKVADQIIYNKVTYGI